jgi:uncharacterized RDD family membrane protein YckC
MKELKEKFYPAQCSTWKRIINSIVDKIILILSTGFIVSTQSNKEPNAIIFTLAIIWFFGGYYLLFEIIFDGKTVGKYITKTRAVYEPNYGKMSFGVVLKRSLTRNLAAFDELRYLFTNQALHDVWSETMVIDDSDFEKLKLE